MRGNAAKSGRERKLVGLLLLFAAVCLLWTGAVSADVAKLAITAEYGQTEARSMLDMINDLRTGRYTDGGQSVPWALNADGSINTARYADLGELTWDYELEETAMQRAMEMAMAYSHNRPDGTSCFSAFPSCYTAGENIAAGYTSAESVFEGWCEADDDYSGQGHRRNMLNPDFNRIGIGHTRVKRGYSYVHYWVQSLAGRNGSTGTVIAAVDEERTVVISTEMEGASTRLYVASDTFSLPVYSTQELPEIAYQVRHPNNWPGFYLTVQDGCAVTVEDPSIASVEGLFVSGLNAGTTSLTIRSRYDDSAEEITLTVEKVSLKEAEVSLPEEGVYVYTGSPLEPVPSVTVRGRTLEAGTDYAVSYASNTDAGEAALTLTGLGNYEDTLSVPFVIEPRSLEDAEVETAEQVYSGEALTPAPKVRLDGLVLEEGTEYEVSYTDHINAGTAVVTVTGTGNYRGSASGSFLIQPCPLDAATLTADTMTYTGEPLTPTPTVSVGGRELHSGKDYIVTYENHVHAGTADFVVSGLGNYTGSAAGSFRILPRSVEDAAVEAEDRLYDGSAQTPAPTVSVAGKVLLSGRDYSVSYQDNLNAGTASVTILGLGDYTGIASGTFEIGRVSVEGAQIEIDDVTYSGEAEEPLPTVTVNGKVLLEGVEYTLSYGDNTNAGTATVHVTGFGNYRDSAECSFTIHPRDLAGISVEIGDQIYSGEELTPVPVVRLEGRSLKAGEDFTVSYRNHVTVGTAEVTLQGVGNYTGTCEGKTFSIAPRSLEDASVQAENRVYTGEELPSPPVVELNGRVLEEGTEYTVSYADNVKVGQASVTISGLGNYTGTAAGSYQILPMSLAAAIVEAEDMDYTGRALKPVPVVTLEDVVLEEGTDYTLSYKDNKNAGTAVVTVTGCGLYQDTAKGNFTIFPKSLGEALVSAPDQVETGAALTPALTVTLEGSTLKAGTDYTAAYKNNTKPGTATVTVTGTGNYTDLAIGTFVIAEKPVPKTAADAVTPESPAALKQVTGAVLKTTNDKDVKGAMFSLLMLKGTPKSSKSIQLTWKQVKGATGYIIYGNRCGKSYKYKKLAEVKKSRKSYIHKKLKKGTYYKYLVVAVKGKQALATSKMIHVATSGGKVGNPKSITLSKKTLKLKKGRSGTVKATVKKGSLKVKSHRAVTFESSDLSVAKVTKSGKITAVGKGSCYIYAYAQNGVSAKVKVQVSA